MVKAVPLRGPSIAAVLAFQNERIVFTNSTAAKLTGYTVDELTDFTWEDFAKLFHPNDRSGLQAWRNQHPKDNTGSTYRLFQRSQTIRHVSIYEWEGVMEDQPATLIELVDVTKTVQLETRQRLTSQIVSTLNLPNVPIRARLTELLSHIRHALMVESVGIRLRADETPSVVGSQCPISIFLGPYRLNCEPFYESKNCLCGKILRRELPNLSCFTENGSFIINHLQTDLTRIDGLAQLFTRNRCTREGFASLASIPIRSEGKSLGILHLASSQPETFPKDSTPFLEGLGELIGLAFHPLKAFEEPPTAKERTPPNRHLKNEFLAAVNHEVRSPLNAIMGFSELLGEAPLEEKYRDYITIIRSRGQDLLQVIDDLLDWARIETDHFTLLDEPFSLRECITSTVSQVQPHAEEKRLTILTTLGHGLPELVRGDARCVHQVLINLLNHLVKSTATGEIELHVTLTAPSKEGWIRVRFTLMNTGVGLASEDSPGHLRSRADTGVNLGLHIVRHLVEKMGGEVRMEREGERGTNFDFCLSFQLPESPFHKSTFVAPTTAPPSMTILLVDDDITSRILFSEILRRDGHTVVEAMDGGMALASISNMDFDLVLMDLQMPVMDGIATTKAIRALKNHGGATLEKRSAVPIVALTAHALREDEEGCLAAGMNGYLRKPLQANTLRDCLRTYGKTNP